MKRDYGRTTITVPLDLKLRMKKARAMVNWSAVACDAFEEKLAEIGPIEEITSVEAALARMKAQKRQNGISQESVNENGKQAGIKWALNFARPNQLQRIEDFRNEIPDDDWEALMTSRDGCLELGRCIESNQRRGRGPGPTKIDPDLDDDWNNDNRRSGRHRRPRMGGGPRHRHENGPDGECGQGHGPGRDRNIWRSILDSRPDHPGFFLGFAEGALEVWKQIKDQL